MKAPYLTEIRAADAFDNIKVNAHSGWPDRFDATNRVEPLCAPYFAAPFAIQPGESVFTIGSCFARNIERSLMKSGFDVPARRAIGADVDPNALNTFTAPSMLNEITWALDKDAPFDPDVHLYDLGRGKVADLHLGVRWSGPTDRATATARRQQIAQAYGQLAHSKMLVLTLGLAEAWYDNALEIYMNSAPLKRLIEAEPDRFRLRVMRQSEVVAQVQRLITLASAHNQVGGLNCVVTVSPVPMVRTFRADTDVIVANAYSKSTLRSAAEEIAYSFDNVAYFPSFESITLSDRHETWEDDQVHVRQALIDLNVSRMIARYVGAPSADVDDAATLAQLAANKISDQHFGEALDLAERALTAQPDLERAFLAKIQALVGLKQRESAMALITARYGDAETQVLDLAHATLDVQTTVARLLLRMKRFEAALELATQMHTLHPKNNVALVALGDAHMGLRQFDAAARAFGKCMEISQRKPAPFFKMAQLEKMRGNGEAARRMVDIALTLKPDHAGALALKSQL